MLLHLALMNKTKEMLKNFFQSKVRVKETAALAASRTTRPGRHSTTRTIPQWPGFSLAGKREVVIRDAKQIFRDSLLLLAAAGPQRLGVGLLRQ